MKQPHTDVIIIGGGHAGLEAATILENLGNSVIIITMDPRSIGRMSCNPAIGGLAKGQMVREIDMLGGKMGVLADFSGIQFKTLNKKKGRAVWSPRAQVDKRSYEKKALQLITKSKCSVLPGEAVSLFYNKNRVCGVLLRSGEKIKGRAVIITAGTFLSGLIHIGERKVRAGRMGEERAKGLTEHLQSMGLITGRLKTGTPPRLNKNSINWKKAEATYGDKNPIPFSYKTKNFSPPNAPCHIVYTNAQAHDVIEENKGRSPMYTGDIHGVGPRYCPSIEDKIHRFKERDSHLLFLEPEWANSDQIYLNGFSTSLPEEVQLEALKKIPAFKNVQLLRPGYAIEYDYFPPSQLKNTLESKDIKNLFFAGQVNGTSGYEEAAAQGLVAGINASAKINNKDLLSLTRDSSYIGVMIDDLITKDTLEPYRMFTSRAEHRLILRTSNTCDRLLNISKGHKLHNKDHISFLSFSISEKHKAMKHLKGSIKPNAIKTKPPIKQPTPAIKILKRGDVSIFDIPNIEKQIDRKVPTWLKNDLLFDLESEIKYEGYIKRHLQEIEKIQNEPNKALSVDTDYTTIPGLSTEAKEKLSFVRPENIGQAKRVSGIKPADLSVLMVYIKNKIVSRETK